MVSVQGARDMYRAVQSAGGTQIRYTEYQGVGHNVWYYKIYRDGSALKEVDNIYTSYTDSLISQGNTCLYQVAAVNYFFKESVLSSAISITTK